MMAEFVQNKSTWQLLDRVRGDSTLSVGELGTTLAALLYLRWADFRESELESIASFDGTEYAPVLPVRFHWRSYCDHQYRELKGLFSSELPNILTDLGNARYNPLAAHLERLAPSVARLGV